ncbi:hypothetical protein [Nocardioides sp.]|uniref:hypothetical protein n=1 Tax=Nocardioides sp. TaxID=35761 RepID=UPI0035129A2C
MTEPDPELIAELLARLITDTGKRTDLDTALAMFGFDRATLIAELTDEPDA